MVWFLSGRRDAHPGEHSLLDDQALFRLTVGRLHSRPLHALHQLPRRALAAAPRIKVTKVLSMEISTDMNIVHAINNSNWNIVQENF